MSKTSRKPHKPLFRRRTAPGAAPGTLVVDPQAPKPVVRLIAFNSQQSIEHELRTLKDLEKIPPILEQYPVTWINVDGLGDAEVVRRLGQIFGLHPLALEDVLNNHQRSKVEQYDDYLFIVARMLENTAHGLESDQLSMFLGRRFVLTFQYLPGDCLDPVRERIRQSRGIMRSAGSDYLAYALLDAVVDSYFPVLERFGEEIEALEDTILYSAEDGIISRIHDIKGKLLMLRRAIWPLREALHVLVRDPIPVIQDNTRIYLRDCADHTFQIIDLVETYRELSSDLMDLYHTSLGTRMNEIMQVLTVIATIFIPLTFIVGVYGMNFDTDISPWNMPELEWRWGYPAVWLVMIVIAGGLLLLFQRKGWLRGRSSRKRGSRNGAIGRDS